MLFLPPLPSLRDHLSSRDEACFGSYHGELSTTLTVGWHYLFHFKGDHWSPLQHQLFFMLFLPPLCDTSPHKAPIEGSWRRSRLMGLAPFNGDPMVAPTKHAKRDVVSHKKPSKYYFDGFYLINYTISAPL